MKKLFLLLCFALSAFFCRAQTYDSISIAHHYFGYYSLDMRNMLEMQDSNILLCCQLFKIDDQGHSICDAGNMFLKVSRHGAVVMDSLFVEDGDLNWSLLAKNPYGDDHIYARIVRDFDSCCSYLNISYFDNDLVFHPEKEVNVPLSDTLMTPLCDRYFLDRNNDIVARYHLSSRRETHLVRCGLDGTLKADLVVSGGGYPFNGYSYGMRHREVPGRRYYETGYRLQNHNMDFLFVEFDSLLHIDRIAKLDAKLGDYLWNYGSFAKMLDMGDNTFMLASRFDKLHGGANGVRVSRYDWDSLQNMKTVFFPTRPVVTYGGLSMGCAFSFGLEKMNDDLFYFAYSTQDPVGGFVGRISVVLMDKDLNILWQRFCLEPTGYDHFGTYMEVLSDRGVAVGGMNVGSAATHRGSEIFLLVFNNDGWGTPETEALMRPYVFYPNPVRDRLSFHYSPDVKPQHVALCDLQGRELCVWRSGFESLDLSGLSAGTYMLRVTLEGGKSYSDPVVKE